MKLAHMLSVEAVRPVLGWPHMEYHYRLSEPYNGHSRVAVIIASDIATVVVLPVVDDMINWTETLLFSEEDSTPDVSAVLRTLGYEISD